MISAARRTINRLRIYMLNSAIRASVEGEARGYQLKTDAVRLIETERSHQVALAKRRNELMGR